jgi:transcriptional regulator with XRE-family HTH domain
METDLSAQEQSPLRAARKAQGLRLRETARLAKIDPSHLSKFERGVAGLSVASLARLAKVLGLKIKLADLEMLVAADGSDGVTKRRANVR